MQVSTTPLPHPTAVRGYIHSFESCGTVDGPGIRFVIFTAGCPLRCLYCANPDSRYMKNGKVMSVDELIPEIQKYTTYMRTSGGGVTVSGGEPLYQPHFVAEIFRRCKALGIHTALDTSGHCELHLAKAVLEYTDLVLLDIKSFDRALFEKVTSVNLEPTLEMARYLDEIGKPTWIRFVLVPGLTDAADNVCGLADFVATLNNVEKVEVLPFHKMGEYKWEQLGYDYQLQQVEPPTRSQIEVVLDIFHSRGINAV
ncbi:pyruvate formate-lyase-activating protein [Oscillatoria sp. FACHB-1406]|uniref:pyruvate formate-lyase-activating protein n=1 Tax=Oscillatoria sp. FACHB-1406 TaxID=2692846 RepID=UPI001688C793|nr:pyruvate formate-lyase-activating protein [Oscillatoria sp. FACHB-1406]MBD2576291.1 pyruvate formate lyase-activating protein [Oscillatoria sp. FACHB-1406]